jgi:predicted aspartyl protease
MGTFHTKCTVSNVAQRKRSGSIAKILVDTGSEYTWIPEAVLEKIGVGREKKDLTFLMANGQRITRSVGFAIVLVDGCFTVDEVVFAEKGDLSLLGARTLEGLNLRVDSRAKKLVAAGPILAAPACQHTES